MQLTPAFAPRLRGLDLSALDRDSAAACGVNAASDIEYVNDTWWQFARDNGARWAEGDHGLGTNLLAVTPEVLRPFYRDLFERTRVRSSPVVHFYECSSPELKRQYGMRLHPLDDGCLLIVHALLSEAPHGDEAFPALEPHYRHGWGSVVQCAHCRRIQRVADTAHWDWVPSLVSQVRWPVSHGLCQPCFEYHYRQPPELPSSPLPRRPG